MRVKAGILIFLFIASISLSQELNFKNFDIENGLVQTQITSILEDSRGFIWFGTYGGGLSRFNGRNFETFDRIKGLTDEMVISVFEDKDKFIWVGTYSGVYKFDGNKFEYMDPALGFPKGEVWTIIGRNDEEIWFSDTKKGIVVYDKGQILSMPELSGLSGKYVVSLFSEKNGTVWVGTNEGLMKYSNRKLEKIPITGITDNFQVSIVFKDSSERLWVGSQTHLFLKSGKEWREFTTRDGLLSNSIWAINESSDGLIRIGTKKGLSIYKGKKFDTITENEGLINNFITSIIEDREKNIWIGTDGGISKEISWFPSKSYSTNSGLKDNNVWSFFEDNDKNILISSDKGIDLISSNTGKIEKNKLAYSDRTFYPMFRDKDGLIWLCNNNKILLIKDNKIINEYKDWAKEFSFFFDVFQDSSNRIWFATNSAGILLFENGKFTQFSDEKIFKVKMITSIMEDGDNRIWFGSDKGIFIFDGSNFKRPSGCGDPDKLYITKILRDKNGKFWIGTYNSGIFFVDPLAKTLIVDKFEYPTSLPERNILSMIFDNAGDLWAGTNVGFFKLDLDNYQFKNSGNSNYFSGNVGMKGVKCNENAIFKDSSGNLWIGTQKGAITFNPEKIRKFLPVPIIHITDVKLFLGDKNIGEFCSGFFSGTKIPKKLILPYNQNHISFKFIGITSAAPEKILYRWKLDSVDSDWSVPSSQRNITYSNLPSGNYMFYVKCSTNSQHWDVASASFGFSITSPFWRTGLFFYLLIFLVIFIFVLIYYLKSKSMKKKEEGLQKNIRERTEELIKEKKKVEMANRALEERVIERTKELEQKNIQLVQSQKLEIIGALAGGVAHDLNNILSGVVSYPDLLLKLIPEDSPNRRYIEIIKHSGEKAAEMVQDLLTLTRKGVMNKEPISINEIVKDFFNGPVFEKLKKNHSNISYTTNFFPGKTFIFGSSIHITKTIMNLVINASEALPIEGKIEISTNRCFLDRPLKGYDKINEGDYIVLSIKDTGIGIDEKDIANIFEPFFSKKRMGRSGTGLGMTVVWWTVKDHSGYIVVNSIKGKGTEFLLYFPASNHDEEKEKPLDIKDMKPHYFGRGEHILIVEDDDDNRHLAEEILSEFNYKVSSVSSGEDAVEFVLKEKVDLLILDMIMGGMNGLETYIQILMHKGEQKAIITSGYSENEIVKETMKLGAGSYVKKPYLKMQLLQAVEAELRKI